MPRHDDRQDAIRTPVLRATERLQEIIETFRGQVQPRPQDNPLRQFMRENRFYLKDMNLNKPNG